MKKSRSLFAGILLFIVLDFSILAINFWIAHQIDKDAIAINLAGRERMLSQRITKTLLALPHSQSPEDSVLIAKELFDAAEMFDKTLSAFANGGMVIGGDGKPTYLNRRPDKLSVAIIRDAQQLWAPTFNRLKPYLTSKTALPDDVLAQVQHEMLNNNLPLLHLMNTLTSEMQNASRNQANTLRIVQTIVFVLALLNFFFIVRKFHLMAHQAHQMSKHYSHLALKDSLTGLFNRRFIENALEHELAQNRNKLTLMMLDLDGFKSINDQYGHKAGDMVLKVTAERLQQLTDDDKIVARLGGDEFIFISTNFTNQNSVSKFCTNLIEVINQPITLHDKNADVQIGASIGIVFHPSQKNSKSDMLHMADHAMYEAKKTGKNRYTFSNQAH